MIYLFNFLKEGEIISKYKDIEKIFNIDYIDDNYIAINYNGVTKRVYIYEIFPITLINRNNEIMEKIAYKYKEFLRLIDFDFQILIKNVKFNVDNYIRNLTKSLKNNNIKNSEVFKRYIENLRESLNKEKIYDTKYYYVVTDSGKHGFIENVDNTLKKLELLGCSVIKVRNKNEIGKILNYFINKEKEEIKDEFL